MKYLNLLKFLVFDFYFRKLFFLDKHIFFAIFFKHFF